MTTGQAWRAALALTIGASAGAALAWSADDALQALLAAWIWGALYA